MGLCKAASTIGGAAAGFAIGGPAGAAVGAGVGLGFGASSEAAKAQQKAGAEAQATAAELDTRAREDRERAFKVATQAAMPTPQELLLIDKMIATGEAGLNRQLALIADGQKVLDAIDPVIKESAAQTLSLLRGEEAKILTPLRAARQRQRGELESQLAQRLGPGFRSSSAGIAALNQFDTQTGEAIANGQLSAFNAVSGALNQTGALGQGIRQGMAAQTGQAFGQQANTLAAALQGIGGIKDRQMRAVNPLVQMPTGSQGILQSAFNKVDIAGNSAAPWLGLAQGFSSLGGNLIYQQNLKDILGATQGGTNINSPATFNIAPAAPVGQFTLPAAQNSMFAQQPLSQFTLGGK